MPAAVTASVDVSDAQEIGFLPAMIMLPALPPRAGGLAFYKENFTSLSRYTLILNKVYHTHLMIRHVSGREPTQND